MSRVTAQQQQSDTVIIESRITCARLDCDYLFRDNLSFVSLKPAVCASCAVCVFFYDVTSRTRTSSPQFSAVASAVSEVLQVMRVRMCAGVRDRHRHGQHLLNPLCHLRNGSCCDQRVRLSIHSLYGTLALQCAEVRSENSDSIIYRTTPISRYAPPTQSSAEHTYVLMQLDIYKHTHIMKPSSAAHSRTRTTTFIQLYLMMLQLRAAAAELEIVVIICRICVSHFRPLCVAVAWGRITRRTFNVSQGCVTSLLAQHKFAATINLRLVSPKSWPIVIRARRVGNA